MQNMYERWLTDRLLTRLQRMPAVVLMGPRQVGKTTLALRIAEKIPSIYLDLENHSDQEKLRDPYSFLPLHSDKLIILDEIQRAPEIFTVLRGLIDNNRQAGKNKEQFLLLGSASMDLLRQSSETLAGRISYLELGGLTPIELNNLTTKDLLKLWVRGGFPQSYIAANDADSTQWREDFIRTYLERDINQLGFRVPAERLRRLWTMLAHLQGQKANTSTLAESMGINHKTVAHYIDILCDLLLVRRLQPYYMNTKKRLVKSPYIYLRDSGILHRLLNINSYEELISHPIAGKSWEGFIIENILSILPNWHETFFYRNASGDEIDLLIKPSANQLWAIEIKKSKSPTIAKGFHRACEIVGATEKFCIYSGEDEYPYTNEITVISLAGMLQKILSELNSII